MVNDIRKSTFPATTFVGILVLSIPRIARVIAPNVQIEDPNYIYGAFLILKGKIPFAEFAQVNPPLLETFLAGMYRVFGVGHRVPEIITAAAYFFSALLLLRLGKRLVNQFTGWLAAFLYSCHFLVFRYHLFEREVFATLAVLAGLEFLTRNVQNRWTPAVAGLIMGLGFACKQTALIPFATVFIFIAIIRRQWLHALLFGLGFLLFVGLLTLGYSAAFGRLYMEQTFWFHWIKGFVAPWTVKVQWTLAGLGFLIPLSLAGLAKLKFKREDWNWLWMFLILTDLIFFWFISGAYWPHYLLSTLPSAALLGAMGFHAVFDLLRYFLRDRPQKTKTGKLRKRSNPAYFRDRPLKFSSHVTALLILAVSLLYFQIFQPGALYGEGAADKYGFGGTPRIEVARAADAIRKYTEESDMIISDPFIALESQRIKVIRFKDNWGLIL